MQICRYNEHSVAYLSILLTANSKLHDNGLSTVTRTILIGYLTKATSNYVKSNEVIRELAENLEVNGGSSVVVDGKLR